MKNTLSIVILSMALLVGGCASLQLQPVDFSWPAEEILDIGSDGMVMARQYNARFNVKPLLSKEFASDSMSAKNAAVVRVIRDKAGFYYITAPKFKNVYVFQHADGALSLSNTVSVSQEKAMDDPKFNQRNTYIELLNNGAKVQLTKGGIQQGGAK